MQWSVELVLRPGSTVLEQRVTLYNRSDVRHRYYWWSNAGVRVWDDSKIFYPMRWTASHGFTEVDTWPVDASGTDVSVIHNQTKGPVVAVRAWEPRAFLWAYIIRTPMRAWRTMPSTRNCRRRRSGRGASTLMAWTGGGALSDDNSAYVEVQGGLMRNQETYAFLEPQQTIRVHRVLDAGAGNRWNCASESGGRFEFRTEGRSRHGRLQYECGRGFGPRYDCSTGSAWCEEARVDLSPEKTWSRDVTAPAGKLTFELDRWQRTSVDATDGRRIRLVAGERD